MSKSIKTLRNDLGVLSDEVQVLGGQLFQSYQKYFPIFVEAVSRQLIMVSYQLCTQNYPESFLRLTYSQRSNLQQKLKDLSQSFQQDLINNLQEIKIENKQLQQNFERLLNEFYEGKFVKNIWSKEININSENSSSLSTDNDAEEINFLAPEDLLNLGLDIETSLENSVNELSRLANNYLQEEKILPEQIPAKILEMAIQAEESSVISNAPPNLLSLLVEKENTNSPDDKNITPITAICLRVAEIEFTESRLNTYRNQIRKLINQVDKITDLFTRKQKQYAIALAESAWRSSWYEKD